MSVSKVSNPWSYYYHQFRRKITAWVFLAVAVGVTAVACAGGPSQQQASGVAPELVADYIHTVLEADRTAYTQHVVNRAKTLEGKEKASGVLSIEATEAWEQTDGIPLPAQMFRLGSEIANESGYFTYGLISPWFINDNQGPKTEFEAEAMAAVVETWGPYKGYQEIGGQTYYSALYPDIAIADACVTCHNTHPIHLERYPDKQFSIGDVMGGVMINIPIEGT